VKFSTPEYKIDVQKEGRLILIGSPKIFKKTLVDVIFCRRQQQTILSAVDGRDLSPAVWLLMSFAHLKQSTSRKRTLLSTLQVYTEPEWS